MPSILWRPVYVGDVFGRQLRFFKSPVYQSSGEPDGPWLAYDDFIKVIGVDPEQAETVFRMLRHDWQEPQTIPTSDGLVTIIPRFMAEGFLDVVDSEPNLFDIPTEPKLLRGRFRNQMTEALKAATAGMPAAMKLAFALSLIG